MKKLFVVFAAAAVLAGATLTGCVTAQSQTLASNEVPSSAVVLGPVSVESKTYSYTNLLKAAQKLYPAAVDVVHIQTDSQSNGKFIMYGIAVRY